MCVLTYYYYYTSLRPSSPLLYLLRLTFRIFGTFWEVVCSGYTYSGEITNKKYT